MKRSTNRKRLKVLGSIVAGALISVGSNDCARAQIPVTDVASLIQQIQSYLQIINQYETQIRQFQTQIQQYQNMVQNTAQLLNGGSWTNIQSALAGISSILNNGQSIITTVGNVNQQMSALFPTFPALLTTQVTQNSYVSSYQALSNNTNDGFRSALAAADRARNDLASDQNALRALTSQAQSATGSVQAIQSVAAVDAQTMTLLEQLKQLLAVNLGAANQYYAQQQELDAEREAATQKALNGPFPGFGTGKSYGYQDL
jgi:P-type conjugative transfer protein TrbJ